MSKNDLEVKKEALKNLLKAIHGGIHPNELKAEFREILAKTSPIDIVMIEQELVKEGVPISDILKLCDLHVELFREFLASRELLNVPRGHPIDLLMKENEWILKQAEALGIYAQAIQSSRDPAEARQYINTVRLVLIELKKIRIHYRKIQMLIFPYLERRGIIAVPRVLWGREDNVITKIRSVLQELEKPIETSSREWLSRLSSQLLELSREISELVFRENKILYPAVYALFSEGEWAAIAEIADEMGYIVDVGVREWRPSAKPVYPYELQVSITQEQLEKLPGEFRTIVEKADCNQIPIVLDVREI